jgi:hypothetical protein
MKRDESRVLLVGVNFAIKGPFTRNTASMSHRVVRHHATKVKIKFCGNLVHFPRFGMFYRERSGNPVLNTEPEREDLTVA